MPPHYVILSFTACATILSLLPSSSPLHRRTSLRYTIHMARLFSHKCCELANTSLFTLQQKAAATTIWLSSPFIASVLNSTLPLKSGSYKYTYAHRCVILFLIGSFLFCARARVTECHKCRPSTCLSCVPCSANADNRLCCCCCCAMQCVLC